MDDAGFDQKKKKELEINIGQCKLVKYITPNTYISKISSKELSVY